MQCPKCKLYNPGEAMRCDCGYDFDSGKIKDSYLEKDCSPKPSKSLVVFGWIFSILGGLIGIIIACNIAFAKTDSEYRYDLSSRRNGKTMLFIAIAQALLLGAISVVH